MMFLFHVAEPMRPQVMSQMLTFLLHMREHMRSQLMSHE